jgi:hypothetical protein
MSCWVVPNVAAEIWGISLDEVMQRIQSGAVISKREYGFLLVDTAPLGPLFHSTATEGKAKPRTWVAVQTWVEVEEDAAEAEREESIDDAGMDLAVDGDSIEEEPDDGVALGWQQKRIAHARLRKPPSC